MQTSGGRGLPAVAVAMAMVLAVGSAAPVWADDADDAETLVRRIYYEGLPADEAAAITPAGAARLVAMLGDPAESAHHVNIVWALGVAGHAGAYEALSAYEAAAGGEVSRDRFRALRALPLAMGHLSRRDARALAWLGARLSRADAPAWHHGRHRGAALARLDRRACASGLGLSDRPEAAVLLEGLAGGPDADIASEALARHRRLVLEGGAP